MTTKSNEIPYIVIGNSELGGKLGETINCPHCGSDHEIKNTQDNGEPSIIDWYKCGKDTYMCGIQGRAI